MSYICDADGEYSPKNASSGVPEFPVCLAATKGCTCLGDVTKPQNAEKMLDLYCREEEHRDHLTQDFFIVDCQKLSVFYD